METVNRPAVLISWPRELDMFSSFIENILGDVVIIADDFIYTENNKFENGKNIIALLDGKVEYVLLSEVLGRVRYRMLFSTGDQTFQKKVTYFSYLKYIYAISIGSVIEHFGLSKLFTDIFGRPLTGGGKHAEKFDKYPVERELGLTVIKYPKGLDISKINYPEDRWKNVFDMYLCHSYIVQGLIVKKFPKAECIKIGYPRYDSVPSVKSAKEIIYNEIKGIERYKPLLLWMPTFNNIKGDIVDNIEVWIPTIVKLLHKYNVLVSVHPKLAVINPSVISYLSDLGFLVDANKGRNLGVLYQSCDLVLADYGGPVLSVIYMKKKLILLNSLNTKFLNWKKKRMYIDDDVRNDVCAFNVKEGASLIEQIKVSIQNNDELERSKLKEKYFGEDCNYEYLREVFSKLK